MRDSRYTHSSFAVTRDRSPSQAAGPVRYTCHRKLSCKCDSQRASRSPRHRILILLTLRPTVYSAFAPSLNIPRGSPRALWHERRIGRTFGVEVKKRTEWTGYRPLLWRASPWRPAGGPTSSNLPVASGSDGENPHSRVLSLLLLLPFFSARRSLRSSSTPKQCKSMWILENRRITKDYHFERHLTHLSHTYTYICVYLFV